jgi:5-methylcytosine-specific restriction endonuclease McrA
MTEDKPAYINSYNGAGKLFEVQPDWCRKPLPIKEDLHISDELEGESVERIKRVLFFDPAEAYQRIGHLINPYQRYTSVGMGLLFPTKEKGLCACGCGKQIDKSSGRRRWATDECNNFAQAVWCIIAGVPDMINKYLRLYHGDGCAECGDPQHGIELDHCHPVSRGGGGAWLSNYKRLCVLHHRHKTNTDFGWKSEVQKVEEKKQVKEKKEKSQMKLDFLSIKQFTDKP